VPTRLLAIGDIHLGRTSGRLPSNLDPARLGPAAALRLAVQTAVTRNVDAVLLAGDVADDTRDFFHALGVLTEVLQPLTEREIPVLAVAGNHDHEVLPKLAELLPNVHLLGAGGVWEVHDLTGLPDPVRILGWSFPAVHHSGNPVQDLAPLPDGPPVIGLLHADLDAARSRYAPVSRHELTAAGSMRWLLGHWHQPSLSDDDTQPGYLGSLVGLDPTETGIHGPWLVQINGPRISLEHLPLAPLRWESLEVAVDDLKDPAADLASTVAAAVLAFAAGDEVDLGQAMAVGVRVRLVGRTVDFAALEEGCRQLNGDELPLSQGDQVVFLDRVANAAVPAHDLEDLARQDDPPGLLARELLALQSGAADDLVHEAGQEVQRVDRQGNFQLLAGATLDDSALRRRILHEGYQVLDLLLAAREVPHGSA